MHVSSVAVTGLNGDDSTFIGQSSSLGMTFLSDTNKEIPVNKSSKPIDIWITKNPNMEIPSFEYINTTNATRKDNSLFLYHAFNITGTNVSLHIQIKPVIQVTGYLVILKFGRIPQLDGAVRDYDLWEVFCPSSLYLNSLLNIV